MFKFLLITKSAIFSITELLEVNSWKLGLNVETGYKLKISFLNSSVLVQYIIKCCVVSSTPQTSHSPLGCKPSLSTPELSFVCSILILFLIMSFFLDLKMGMVSLVGAYVFW